MMPFFKFRYLLLSFVFFASWGYLVAQETLLPDSTLMDSVNFVPNTLEWGVSAGRVLVMDQYQRLWTHGTATWSCQMGVRHRTLHDRFDAFAAEYNFPEWGVLFSCADYSAVKLQKHASPEWGLAVPVDYVSHPGKVFSLMGTFSRPLCRFHRWQWGYTLEEGLAYCTRPYRMYDNVDNELTGSSVLIHFGASVYASFRWNRRWSIRGDLLLRHVSNGATQRPNKGLNAVFPLISLQYHLDREMDQSVIRPFLRPIKPYWYCDMEMSLGSRTLLEDWLRTQYATPPNELDYRTDRFTHYWTYNGSFAIMRRYTRRWATGLAIDLFYLPYANQLRKLDRMSHPEAKHSCFSAGLSVRHEAFYHALSAYVHLGWYGFRRTGSLQHIDETPYYERVGLRYRLPGCRNLKLGIGVKAHRLKADFTEMSITYQL